MYFGLRKFFSLVIVCAVVALLVSLSLHWSPLYAEPAETPKSRAEITYSFASVVKKAQPAVVNVFASRVERCLLYTSPSPRDRQKSRMPSSA